MHKVFLSSIKYCFHLTVFVINAFFVHLSIWGIIRESSKCSVSFTKYQISLKLENSINIFITFPIKINANSISMENGETKIKGQKQQFFSKVLFGLMTFFLWKKILSKAISSTNYLTEMHLEWLGSNQSVWAHRKMTCYMILTEMTSLCEQKHSMGLVQPMKLGDWLLFYLAHVQRRTIFLWHLLKSHCKFFIQKYTGMKTKFPELLYAWSENPMVILYQISCALHILS